MKVKYFSMIEFIAIFILLLVVSTLPAILYGGTFIDVIFNRFTLWYILYWLCITFLICAITAYQKYKTFSHPLKTLSNAAKKVAEGDFSVYIEPPHRPDQRNYMDVMFDDFNQMVKELGSIETLKNDFISNVSHELKTPLAIIQNYATLLEKSKLTSQQQEYTDNIIQTIKQLTHLITNILKLNKLENQEIFSPPTSFDVCHQLCDCILRYETLLEAKEIDLIVEIEDRAIISNDKELLELVWHNLLSNAIKFTNQKGQITIKQTSQENWIVVEISDNGCGMDNDTMNHIFDKFYQGDTSHAAVGNGLGLTLVYRILEKIGATISFTSELEKGTSFYIKIPL